jgi:hypothetical protein
VQEWESGRIGIGLIYLLGFQWHFYLRKEWKARVCSLPGDQSSKYFQGRRTGNQVGFAGILAVLICKWSVD